MTIGRKITLTFCIPVALSLLPGLGALSTMDSMTRQTNGLFQQVLPGIEAIGRMSATAKDIRGAIRGHITAKSDEDRDKSLADLDRLGKEADGYMAAYRPTVDTEEDRRTFEPIPGAFARLLASAGPIRALDDQGRQSEAMEQFRAETMLAYKALNQMIEAQAASVQRIVGDIRELVGA
jgi:CHASE3 domain sensor protein